MLPSRRSVSRVIRLTGSGLTVMRHDVAVEQRAQVGQVSNADVRVVVLVVGHEQRVQPEHVLHDVDDEVGIARPVTGTMQSWIERRVRAIPFDDAAAGSRSRSRQSSWSFSSCTRQPLQTPCSSNVRCSGWLAG